MKYEYKVVGRYKSPLVSVTQKVNTLLEANRVMADIAGYKRVVKVELYKGDELVATLNAKGKVNPDLYS